MAEPEGIKAGDSWEEVNEYCLRQGWTDGLPIVPPTPERVQAALEYTVRDPQEPVAILEPKRGVATVEKIAINAVMAGCRPQYLPVLIAAVQAVGEGDSTCMACKGEPTTPPPDGGQRPHRPRIGYQLWPQHTGDRWQSSATLCRALNFVITNIGGIPGASNINSQGQLAKFRHCIAENEADSPWEPLHVERGFPRDQSTVTVFAGASQPIDDNGGSKSAKDIVTLFALSIAQPGNRNTNGEGEPLIIFVPHHAQMLARDGYSKRDVQRFLFERARLRFGDIPGPTWKPSARSGTSSTAMFLPITACRWPTARKTSRSW